MDRTAQQALDQYHLAYNNMAYRSICKLIACLLAGTSHPLADVTYTPEYIELTNLLTDTALEICGHPAYRGRGWTLAFRLHQLATNYLERGAVALSVVQHTFAAVEIYLDLFRRSVTTREDRLNDDPTSKAISQMEGALILLEESVRTTSDLPSRRGRAAYHLTAACVGLLRTAMLLLKSNDVLGDCAAEKFSRALRDMVYGLNEIAADPDLPHIFSRASTYLLKCLEEK
ncbi:MAG: hypothetical protein DPW16_19625 [Chloroflexi bacterium]|nr:hypothetical protein [Chloroflexota bacterium]